MFNSYYFLTRLHCPITANRNSAVQQSELGAKMRNRCQARETCRVLSAENMQIMPSAGNTSPAPSAGNVTGSMREKHVTDSRRIQCFARETCNGCQARETYNGYQAR